MWGHHLVNRTFPSRQALSLFRQNVHAMLALQHRAEVKICMRFTDTEMHLEDIYTYHERVRVREYHEIQSARESSVVSTLPYSNKGLTERFQAIVTKHKIRAPKPVPQNDATGCGTEK